VCVFSAASADTGFAYNHTASWYGVVAGWAAGFALDSKRRYFAYFAALSGVFACLCFLTKQTVGLGITAMIPVIAAVAYWRLRLPARALGFTLGYVAGWMIPGAMFFGWLWRQGAWTAFLSDNFIKGPSSKGSLVDVLMRPVRQTLGDPWLTQEFVAATVLVIVVFLVLRRSPPITRERAGLGSVALVAAAMAFTVVVAFFLSEKSFVTALARIQRIWIYVSITGALGCLCLYGLRLLRGKWNEQDGQMLLLGGVSFAIAYMHSLSFATTEAMSMPGFAFLAVLAMSQVSPRPFFRAVGGPIAIAACFIAAFGAVCLKIHTPFAWYSFNEGSAHSATETSTLPQLQGLYMSPQAKTFVERLTAVIRTHSGPDDPVYLFFYLPLIYGLTDRRPPTVGFNHFIDVAPDYLAEEDADRLLVRKPKLFVYSMLQSNELREWEKLFRCGKPSGQRHLVAVLDRLSSEYRLLDTLQFPGSGRLVKVFERTTP